MTDTPTHSPEFAVAQSDPGDETAKRYRFQWAWAAIVCCKLLDDTRDIKQVFCEHHEDVLLKHQDDSFEGHQVKTRDGDQPPWKAKDEAVLAACVRFVKLDSEYPGQFRRFCFMTNHQLYSAGNGQDLPHVLKLIKDAATLADLCSPVDSWVKRVAREAGVAEALAFAALSKTVARSDLPKLDDALMRLIDAIVLYWDPAKDCSHDAVRRSAIALIDECGHASSLDHEQLLPAYMIETAKNDTDIATRIYGKCMTLARVKGVLEQGRDSAATLEGDVTKCAPPGEGSTDLLQRKLDAGGFSAVSMNSAEDLRDKADYLGIRWTKQFGNSKGLARYDHVRTLVLSDAGRSFDETQTDTDGFGPVMREDLRRRFRERRADGDQLFDTTDDHLEGFAFSLTAQCKVVWSHTRPWELDDGSS